MRKLVCCMVLLLGNHAWAGEGGAGWPKRLWKVSLAAVAAGSAMDVQSSWGKRESNSLLANRQGNFSIGGLGLKLAIAGAAVGTQEYLLHRHPAAAAYKAGAMINFAVAGTLSAAAIHNYKISSPR